MDFNFFNYTTEPKGLRRVLYWMQRATRRVQRPSFNRLRDLLRFMYDRQQDDHHTIEHLQHRIAQLEATIHDLHTSRRAAQLDQVALVRRTARLEDLLIQVLAHAEAPAHDYTLPTEAELHTKNGRKSRVA